MSSVARPLAARALGALLVALVALATAALVARAQEPTPTPIEITVQPPHGAKPGKVDLATVKSDITATYKLAKPDGSTETLLASEGKGSSVLEILKATQTDFNYARIDIPRPDGGFVTITKDQIRSVKPPFFFTDAQGVTRFVGAPGKDGVVPANAHFEVSGPILLTQFTTPRLNVSISPKKKTVKLGATVTFAAKVDGARSDDKLTYGWVMRGSDDGEKWDPVSKVGLDQPTFTHKFPRKDRVYRVQVTVKVDGDESNAPGATATIIVGNPDLSGKKEKEGEGGDNDSGGTGNTGGSSGGTGTGSGSGSGSYYDGGSSTYSPPAYTPPAYTPEPSVEPVDPPDPPDIATAGGTTVEGNLLADASSPPQASLLEDAAKAAREGKVSEDSDSGASVPEAAISIAGVLALLGLGAGLEFREGKLPRLRVPRLPLSRRGA